MPGPVPNVFRTGQLKSKILDLSQSSVYQVKIQPPPKVKDFIEKSSRGFKYDKDGENMELLCSETTLPGTSLSTHEVTNDYAGVTEKMAYRRMFDSTIDMTFYVDKEYGVIEFFDGWMDWISGMNRKSPIAGDERELYRRNTSNYRFNYPNTYKAPIYLTKFEKNLSDRQMSYEFIDAFPLNVISIPVSYAQSEILKLSVSFAYTRYVRFRSKSNVFTEYSDFFDDNNILKIRL